ncbi:hypothetical protein M8J77_009482 [Diaphorina citri]|nr:hypothetical protein M8J77_009482 [Diaphorina citri]
MDLNRSNTNKLTILNWNSNGIKRQKNIFTHFINHHDIDVACISETHLVENETFRIPNYQVYRKDRNCDHAAGGVAIIIKKSIKHESLYIPDMVSFEITASAVLHNTSSLEAKVTKLEAKVTKLTQQVEELA